MTVTWAYEIRLIATNAQTRAVKVRNWNSARYACHVANASRVRVRNPSSFPAFLTLNMRGAALAVQRKCASVPAHAVNSGNMTPAGSCKEPATSVAVPTSRSARIAIVG